MRWIAGVKFKQTQLLFLSNLIISLSFLQRAEPLIMTLLDENEISEKKKEEEK